MSSVVIEPPTVIDQSLDLDFGVFRVDLGEKFNLDESEFAEFCARNSDLRIERTKEGDIVIMPPTHSKTGIYNLNLAGEFRIWSKQNNSGIGFDSSTGFTLPNGAIRSPDLSWIQRSRWDALSPAERSRFAHICPDFVVEVRSDTDRLPVVQAKMAEYIENGAQLGWLIDPIERKVHVYRPGVDVEILEDPANISGEPVLPGFVLDMAAIWD